MEMATCFASPRASPVRGLLALFLLGGRKVWEAWEGRALGRPLLSPVFLLGGRKVWEPGRGRLWVQSYSLYPDLSFLPGFCAVAGRRCGKPGRGGLWVQSYPFPGLSFLPCFCAMAGRCGKRGSGPWVQSYPFSRPLLSRMFLLGGRKVWEAWEGRALGTELSVSRPPSPVCHCAKHGKRRSLERGNFME